MVSLFDISTQKPLWSHLTTGVPTLDLMLRLQTDALLDLQSVPSNASFSAVLCSLVASHLLLSLVLTVIVLETLNPFAWQVLEQHPLYSADWADGGRIVTYSVPTFAQLYAFFAFMPLQDHEPGSVLVVVTNFHETVELYRLQASATHEEVLLKHQIDNNRHILENMHKVEKDGLHAIELPPMPRVARENPFTKAQNHVNGLIRMMSDFTFKTSAVVLLAGHLEPKFVHNWRKEQSSNPSSEPSLRSSQVQISQSTSSFNGKDNSRLVLQPVVLGTSGDKPSLIEGKITARMVFYNDWFYKSPYFERVYGQIESRHRFLVAAVKVFNLSGINNINDPVYFHFDHLSVSSTYTNSAWLIDLSEPEKEEEALAELIQNSITSTQLPARDTELFLESDSSFASGVDCQKRKARKICIPSSPTNLANAVGDESLDMLLSKERAESPRESNEESTSEEDQEEKKEEAREIAATDFESGNESDSEHGSESGAEDREQMERKSAESHESSKTISSRKMLAHAYREKQKQCDSIPELIILDEHERLFIEGSDVELTGTLLEDMEESDNDWLARHS